jgi:isochorismate hydrolase
MAEPERIDPRRADLIAYDVCRRALTPSNPTRLAEMGPVLNVWVRMIAAARAAGVPVIYTTPISRADGADVVMLLTDLSAETGVPPLINAVEGTAEAGLPEEIAPRPEGYSFLKRRPSAFSILVLLSGMLLGGISYGATPAGLVAYMRGASTAHGAPLQRGDAVQVGDTVATPVGSILKLQMEDGSVLTLAPGTSVTIASYNVSNGTRQARLSLAEGLLRAVVAPASRTSSFEVATAPGTASVRSGSADWIIDSEGGMVQVGVIDGRVELTGTSGRSVRIPGHWGTRLGERLDPVPPRVWAQVEFDGFIRRTECCQSPQPSIPAPPEPLRSRP